MKIKYFLTAIFCQCFIRASFDFNTAVLIENVRKKDTIFAQNFKIELEKQQENLGEKEYSEYINQLNNATKNNSPSTVQVWYDNFFWHYQSTIENNNKSYLNLQFKAYTFLFLYLNNPNELKNHCKSTPSHPWNVCCKPNSSKINIHLNKCNLINAQPCELCNHASNCFKTNFIKHFEYSGLKTSFNDLKSSPLKTTYFLYLIADKRLDPSFSELTNIDHSMKINEITEKIVPTDTVREPWEKLDKNILWYLHQRNFLDPKTKDSNNVMLIDYYIEHNCKNHIEKTIEKTGLMSRNIVSYYLNNNLDCSMLKNKIPEDYAYLHYVYRHYDLSDKQAIFFIKNKYFNHKTIFYRDYHADGQDYKLFINIILEQKKLNLLKALLKHENPEKEYIYLFQHGVELIIENIDEVIEEIKECIKDASVQKKIINIYWEFGENSFRGFKWRNKENLPIILHFFDKYVQYCAGPMVKIADSQENFENNPHGGKEFLQVLERLNIIDENTKFDGIPYKSYKNNNEKQIKRQQELDKAPDQLKKIENEINKFEEEKNKKNTVSPKTKMNNTKDKKTKKPIYKNPLFIGGITFIALIFTYFYLKKISSTAIII